MLRPSFPTIVRESEKHDINSEVIVIVDDAWKVGDLVDWFTDGCFWSGEVTKILGKDKVQVTLSLAGFFLVIFEKAFTMHKQKLVHSCTMSFLPTSASLQVISLFLKIQINI